MRVLIGNITRRSQTILGKRLAPLRGGANSWNPSVNPKSTVGVRLLDERDLTPDIAEVLLQLLRARVVGVAVEHRVPPRTSFIRFNERQLRDWCTARGLVKTPVSVAPEVAPEVAPDPPVKTPNFDNSKVVFEVTPEVEGFTHRVDPQVDHQVDHQVSSLQIGDFEVVRSIDWALVRDPDRVQMKKLKAWGRGFSPIITAATKTALAEELIVAGAALGLLKE